MSRPVSAWMPALGLVAGLSAVAGCNKAPTEATVKPEVLLNVRTLDLGGHPVESVRFYINGKKFGITDQDGSFQGRYSAKEGETLTFNVEAPMGYSVPPTVDQSRWQLQIHYPEDRPLQVEFTATLQRPEREYLLMVRTGSPVSPVQVNNKLVGKTGNSGEALLKVTGVPGTAFFARVSGNISYKGVFAEDDEIYLMTPEFQGPLGKDDSQSDPSTESPVAPPAPVLAMNDPPAPPAPVAPAPPAPVPAPAAPVPAPAPAAPAAPVPAPPPAAPAPVIPLPHVATNSTPPVVSNTRPEVHAGHDSTETHPSENHQRAQIEVVSASKPSSTKSEPATQPAVVIPAPTKSVNVASSTPEAPAPKTVEIATPVASAAPSVAPAVAAPSVAAAPAVVIPAPSASSHSDSPRAANSKADDIIEADPPAKVAKADVPEPMPVKIPEDDIIDDTPAPAPVIIAAATPSKPKSVAVVGDGPLDDGDIIDANAASKKTAVAAGSSVSVATMSREEISSRLSEISQKRENHQVLTAVDIDFLGQVDRTSPSYGEANRLLADYYYDLKDYDRQIKALENATSAGPLKRDPQVLLSLAKSYAQKKNYRKALRTMQRVDENARRLPPDRKADAMRFHAEILEFEFLRQYEEDPKGANMGLLDKAIEKWERYKTFASGADAAGEAKARTKIDELTQMKRRMEL